MNKVVLQLWEETTDGKILNDGCSIHLSLEDHEKFISTIYKNRSDNEIPDSYDRIIGDFEYVYVSDEIYNSLLEEKSLKISEPSLQNMILYNDLVFNDVM